MPERLPDAWITTYHPISLAEKLRDLAKSNHRYYVAYSESKDDNFTIILKSEALADLEIRVVSTEKAKMFVELRGAEWNYEEYVNDISAIVKPLLKAINKRDRSRYRLICEKEHKILISIRATVFLDNFAERANKSNLHIWDWRRFYLFVEAAPNLSGQSLRELLLARDFADRQIDQMIDAFWHIKLYRQKPTASEILEVNAIKRNLKKGM